MRRFSRVPRLWRRTAVVVAVLAALGTLAVSGVDPERTAQAQDAGAGRERVDPALWADRFPLHYERFAKTRENYGETPYGGSTPYSKLERHPAMVRLWAGYAFAIDHNEERGHHYAQVDQRNSKRVSVAEQPGACINCHAAEAPGLIAELGWAAFNRTPYNHLKDRLHFGSSCSDCHDTTTMQLAISRPALRNALRERGIEPQNLGRSEMRSYVCAQCHVEYYFLGEDRILTFPWSRGLSVEAIEQHYDAYGFRDWRHGETSAPMIKIQHPEFEMWSSGKHARAGVSCADCHMPSTELKGSTVTDHWIRSPLTNLKAACGKCHGPAETELKERVARIQDATALLLRQAETALLKAIDSIVAARRAGVGDDALTEPLGLHRAAQLRWDFVSSENSTGFHSPQEAARILGIATDLAGQAERMATQATPNIK